MIRNTVRVLILNQNRLLLMRIDNADISFINGNEVGSYWLTVGGKIEDSETIEQAALRETYEEAGISKENIELGPIVWFNEIDWLLKGKLIRFKQSYVVAQTEQNDVRLLHPSYDEQATVKEHRWFSLQEIQDSTETILPVFLKQHLPAIINKNYPTKTLVIE